MGIDFGKLFGDAVKGVGDAVKGVTDFVDKAGKDITKLMLFLGKGLSIRQRL